MERTQKLFNEAGQERLTRLDRSLIARAKDGILSISAAEEADPVQQTLRVGRLRTLERLGLAKGRQQGVWALDAGAERKLRQLGERADKFKMMQRALKEAGIERAAASMALFERGPRKAPLIGKVVGLGLVDEITDRTWVVEPGRQIAGIYDRSITTPTGKLAVIRHQDTFTLAPWRPAYPLKYATHSMRRYAESGIMPRHL